LGSQTSKPDIDVRGKLLNNAYPSLSLVTHQSRPGFLQGILIYFEFVNVRDLSFLLQERRMAEWVTFFVFSSKFCTYMLVLTPEPFQT
jgi:hypothetical protein